MKQDRYQWVEVTTIPQYNWHTPGTDTAPQAKLNDDGAAPNVPPPPAVKSVGSAQAKSPSKK
jgi:hypothetical protein